MTIVITDVSSSIHSVCKSVKHSHNLNGLGVSCISVANVNFVGMMTV